MNETDPQRIGLWGRSMGAVSSILFASRSDKVKALVLDSPFSSFPLLMKDYMNRYKVLPSCDVIRYNIVPSQVIAKFAGKLIERKMREKIKEIANFDINELTPINHVSKIKCPVVFLHGKNDSLVSIKHSKDLYEVYTTTSAQKHYLIPR